MNNITINTTGYSAAIYYGSAPGVLKSGPCSSLSLQEHDCRELAAKLGIHIAEYFGDLQEIGDRFQWPGFSRMLEFLNGNKSHGSLPYMVIVHEMCCIAVSNEEFAKVNHAISQAGGEIIIAGNPDAKLNS